MAKHASNSSADGNLSASTDLIISLNDKTHLYTKKELEQIIRNEFFNDDKQLDIEVVDAALKRIMLLDGEAITEQTLQARRQSMMKSVFAEILGIDDPKSTN